jgi:hypothetical protein
MLAALAGPACAGGKSDAESRAKTIAPYLDTNVFAVARYDLTRPDCDALAVTLCTIGQPLMGVLSYHSDKDLKALFAAMRKAGAKDLYALYSFAEPGFEPVFVVPLGEGANAKELAGLFTGPFAIIHTEKIGAAVVFGTRDACQRMTKIQVMAHPELPKAFAAIPDRTGQFYIVPSQDARRAFEELIPILPPELGGGASALLARGLDWAAIGLDGPPKMSLHAVVQATDEATAGKLQDWIGVALKALAKNPEVRQVWKEFDAIAAALKPTRTGSQLVMKLDHDHMTKLIDPAVAKGQFAGHRKMVVENLKHIGLAMHNYLDNNKGLFPTPANYDKQGKPLLSWRVHLLPYLEQGDLYKEFKLDEPWDSAHNKQLIARMPPIYMHPLRKGAVEGKTAYVVPVGKDTVFPGGKGIGIRDITDGTSNTVLVFEAADSHMVIWTKPDDWEFNVKEPHKGIVDKSRPTFIVLFADGSVRHVRNEVSAETLRAIITRNGGEVIGRDLD